MMMRSLVAVLGLAAVTGGAWAANDSIAAKDQKLANGGIVASNVMASKAGYLVVHESDASGTKPGKVIGNAPVKSGENKDVAVPLAGEVKSGAKLILMLHEESDGDAKFDEKDKPVRADGNPVVHAITIEKRIY